MASNTDKSSVRYGSAKAAIDVNIEFILDYLCDKGPSFCSGCPSQCAYGKRYLKEYVSFIQERKND